MMFDFLFKNCFIIAFFLNLNYHYKHNLGGDSDLIILVQDIFRKLFPKSKGES